MFKYLEKLLGKPIRFYENLMASKTEQTAITSMDINKVVKALEPYVLKAFSYENDTMSFSSYPLEGIYAIPQNKKEIDFIYTGTYVFKDTAISLFIDSTKGFNDKLKYQYFVQKSADLPVNLKQNLNQLPEKEHLSLPIWEEVIHRFPEVHKTITSINSNHPWTLYKKTKETFQPTKNPVVLGGYPQWRVNNVDFRKLEKLTFLMEYRVIEKNYSIYFFRDLTTEELVIMEQKS